jgi:hypothetical protein
MGRTNLNKNLARQRLLKCGRCSEIKNIADFYANAASATKRDNYCKPCRKLAVKEYNDKANPSPEKASQVLGINPNTPICRELGELELHIIRERDHNGLTAWCNRFFTTLPLMFLKDLEGQLDIKRCCGTCKKALFSAGFSLPTFGAPELRLGWSEKP